MRNNKTKTDISIETLKVLNEFEYTVKLSICILNNCDFHLMAGQALQHALQTSKNASTVRVSIANKQTQFLSHMA